MAFSIPHLGPFRSLLLTTYYVLLTTYYLLLNTYYILLTTYYLLLTTYYLLLTTYDCFRPTCPSEQVVIALISERVRHHGAARAGML